MVDAIIEAAARAMIAPGELFTHEEWEEHGEETHNVYRAMAEAALAAVAPLIRAAALEEAAKIFDEDSRHLFDGQGIAAAIRSLKEVNILAAVTPLIRAQALEEAATVAASWTCGICGIDGASAAAIRALKEQP